MTKLFASITTSLFKKNKFSSLLLNNGGFFSSLLSLARVPPEVNLSARGPKTKKEKTGKCGHPAALEGFYY